MRTWLKTMFGPLWSGRTMSMTFFADDAGAGGGAGKTDGAPAAGTGDENFIGNIFDAKGMFKEGWNTHLKDEIGDSKHFDTTFKAGQHGVKDLVKEVRDLLRFKGRALLPKEDADDSEWQKVWETAGIPKKAEDYGLELDGGIEDPGFKEFLDKSGYLGRIADIFVRGHVPMKLASQLATGIISRVEDDYNAFQKESKDIRDKIEAGWQGKIKWDDAEKDGRAAMARLYGHTDEKPSEEMQGLIKLLESARLANHPLVVDFLHRIHQRMNPARVFTTGSRGPTGPGVKKEPNYAQVMMPESSRQVAALPGA